MASIVKALYRPVFHWAVRRGLVGRRRSPDDVERARFTHEQAGHLLRRTWALYDEMAPRVPRERKLGPWMNVHLAAATIAFQRALVESGVEARYANSLTADCAWVIYERWGWLARRIAGLRSSDPHERMRVAIEGFLRFPFTYPCYRYRLSRPSPDKTAIDMRRCPVADYMAAEGASDLCVDAWCDQDYALAGLWGGRLERAKTLARGDERCDFLFVADPGGSPAER